MRDKPTTPDIRFEEDESTGQILCYRKNQHRKVVRYVRADRLEAAEQTIKNVGGIVSSDIDLPNVMVVKIRKLLGTMGAYTKAILDGSKGDG